MDASSNWCRHQESNPGPTDYKSVALPQLSYSGIERLYRSGRAYYQSFFV